MNQRAQCKKLRNFAERVEAKFLNRAKDLSPLHQIAVERG